MISIIVPVYNVKDYIERCVASLLNQTQSEFEIILVDDGSTDGSGAICDKLQKTDSRIQVIHQQNRGLSGARNQGLKAAMGEWITYIDS
ncbi:MAG: glycosyltransferase family 2 protein, partial [Acetivibrio ethanolgignens]